MLAPVSLISTEDELAAFVRSMPPAYAAVFSEPEIGEHFRIVRARGTNVAHAEISPASARGLVAACVVADDRPGILSLIATALVMHRLDVRGAQVFCRCRPDGQREAVDFFWLGRSSPYASARPIDDDTLAAVTRTICGLMTTQGHAVRTESPRVMMRPAETARLGPRVYLDVRALQRGECTLVVEVRDRPGLLLDVSRALFKLGVETIASEVRVEGGTTHHRFGLGVRNRSRLTSDEMARARAAVFRVVAR